MNLPSFSACMQFSIGWIQKKKKKKETSYAFIGFIERLPEERRKLKKFTSNLDPVDVYNTDETDFFFVWHQIKLLQNVEMQGKKLVLTVCNKKKRMFFRSV